MAITNRGTPVAPQPWHVILDLCECGGAKPVRSKFAMPYGLYLSAEGALAQSRRMEVVANNLANVETIGFKRQLAGFQARYTEAAERGLDLPGNGTLADLGGGVMFKSAKTDYSMGPIEHTRNPSDLAINGDGFFVVQKGGQNMLTRAGNFVFDANGVLVTPQGYPVMSENNTPMTIDPEAGPWTFQPDGSLVQDGELQSLAIVMPRSKGDLAHASENLFLPLGPVQMVPPDLRSVQRQTIELSGVNPTQEMMEMIETSRAFEANVNMIRNQDQMIGNLVSRVLKEA
jgi:flagellar basal-body rod protein FlgF/flagellar basal-body rod protein FlgG